jgi:hypothetical protein
VGARTEVEAGLLVADPGRGDGVQVALAQDDVVAPGHLDLGAVLGVEEHAVLDLHLADVVADGDDGAPLEPATECGRRRDDDAAARPALTLALDRDEHPVVQHPDREAVRPLSHDGGAGPRDR